MEGHTFKDQLIAYFMRDRLDLPEDFDSSIHKFLTCIAITAPLMWAYAINAYLHSSSSVQITIGFVGSSVHLLSPFLIRYVRSMTLPTMTMLLAGVSFQAVSAYYNGGFQSLGLIWFGVIPFFAGICDNKRSVWLVYPVLIGILTVFLYLDLQGYPFPKSISPRGHFISVALMCYGWVTLSFFAIIFVLKVEEKRRGQIAEANKNTNDLLRLILHDLSNPLSVAGTSISLLEKKLDANAKSQKSFSRINNSLENITEILQKVKEMQAVQSGKMRVAAVEANLLELFEESIAAFKMQLASKQIEVKFEREELALTNVLVDPVLFKHQILGNILSNAIKFSAKGSAIEVFTSVSAQGKVELTIQDHGIGMSPELLDGLFAEGVQNSRKGTAGEKGTGFGMMVMKAFLDAMGVEFKIFSVPKLASQKETDTGTKFVLYVLLAQSNKSDLKSYG